MMTMEIITLDNHTNPVVAQSAYTILIIHRSIQVRSRSGGNTVSLHNTNNFQINPGKIWIWL